LEFPKLTPIIWLTYMYCLLWQILIEVEDLITTCNTHIWKQCQLWLKWNLFWIFVYFFYIIFPISYTFVSCSNFFIFFLLLKDFFVYFFFIIDFFNLNCFCQFLFIIKYAFFIPNIWVSCETLKNLANILCLICEYYTVLFYFSF